MSDAAKVLAAADYEYREAVLADEAMERAGVKVERARDAFNSAQQALEDAVKARNVAWERADEARVAAEDIGDELAEELNPPTVTQARAQTATASGKADR